MDRQKYSSSWVALSVAFCVALMSFSLATPPLRAQSRFAFPRRERVGTPRTTIGGATRSPSACTYGVPSLTVLSPLDNVVTTVAANPTLFWYIPKTQAKSAEFLLYDNQKQIVYQTTLPLKDTPGVVKLTLPKAVTLRTNQEYKWKFALRCNLSANWQEDVALGGVIQRQELTSAQKAQLAAAKQPLQQAQVYATAGIWQETLSILAQLHRDRPSNRTVNEAWKELLESVELKELAEAPLVECCTAAQ